MPEDKKEEKNAEEAPSEKDEKQDEEYEGKERFLRLAAEFDNYKKRVAKEIDSAKSLGKAELAAKILPVLDEFQLAMENIDIKTEHGKGFAIVLSNLMDTLKKEGLKEIECDGIYDPYQHEVMMTKEGKEKEGTVVGVLRKGYTLNGIMLRPASVIVAKEIDEKEDTKKE